MNIGSTALSSIQSSIYSGINTLTAGAEKTNTTQVSAINTALDSFQSVNLKSEEPSVLNTALVPDAGSFVDPLSFYKNQNSDSAVTLQLRNPTFQPAPNLKALFDQLRNVRDPFASRGGINSDNSALPNLTNMIAPSEAELKLKELQAQLGAKVKEAEEVKKQIQEKIEEINKKSQESEGISLTGVSEVDGALDVLLSPFSGGNKGPSEDLLKAQQELAELQAKLAKLNSEIEDLQKQIDAKNEIPGNMETNMVGKSQQNLSVDPFSASILTQPNQTLLDFQRVIGLQLDFNSDKLFQQRSLLIRP